MGMPLGKVPYGDRSLTGRVPTRARVGLPARNYLDVVKIILGKIGPF